MDENQNPEKQAKSGHDHLREAAGNFKEAASAKVENIRQAAGQKVDELRGAAQDKAQELRGAAESAWSDTKSHLVLIEKGEGVFDPAYAFGWLIACPYALSSAT